MYRTVWQLLVVCVFLCAKLTAAHCPNVCSCDTDEFGRRRVRCENGGVQIPENFDLATLDPDTEVLIMSGSSARPNVFNLNAQRFIGKKFKEIHLSHSQMEYTGERTFTGVQKTLLVLNLTHNSLRALSENNFRNLSQLTHLHLDYNRLTTIHSAMFPYLVNLKVLTVSNNAFNDVPQRMGIQLFNLEVLDFTNNPIGVPVMEGDVGGFPDHFFSDFPSLKVLHLGNTSLTSLPWTAIQRFNPLLEELDLSWCRLQNIQPGQVNLIRNLRRVRLGKNPLSIASGSFSGLNLESLDLSGNRAENILQPGVFDRAIVKKLDMSYTGLATLDPIVFVQIGRDLNELNISGNPGLVIQAGMFGVFPNLRSLTMNQMSKTSLPATLFNYNNSIKQLDLSSNGLTALPDRFFSKIKHLETLSLSGNQLRSVPSAIAALRLKWIDLSNNMITALPEKLVQALSVSVTSLQLNGNPWNCDCRVAKLARLLVRRPLISPGCLGAADVERNCPVCNRPSRYRGTLLSELPKQFFALCDL